MDVIENHQNQARTNPPRTRKQYKNMKTVAHAILIEVFRKIDGKKINTTITKKKQGTQE